MRLKVLLVAERRQETKAELLVGDCKVATVCDRELVLVLEAEAVRYLWKGIVGGVVL